MQYFQKYLTWLRATGHVSMLGLLLALAIESSVAARATGLLFEDTKVPANYPQVEGAPTWSLEAVRETF